jgi:hypothetical protein
MAVLPACSTMNSGRAYGLSELQCLLSCNHPLWRPSDDFVTEGLTERLQRVAHCRLANSDFLRGSGDASGRDQRFEVDQEIEIETAEIHGLLHSAELHRIAEERSRPGAPEYSACGRPAAPSSR